MSELFRTRHVPAVVAFALVTGVGLPAVSQPQVPGGGQSGTIEGQLRRPEAPLSTATPFVIERPRPGQAPGTVKFLVRSIVVEGVTVLDKAAVDAVLARYTGRELTLADVSRAADDLTQLYSDAGYGLSFAAIPVQTVRDGVVRIVIVEGRIDQVSVTIKGRGALVGSDRIAQAVKARIQRLADGTPVRSAQLERAVLGVADLAGMRASVVVRPSASVEGAADLVVEVSVDPLETSLSLDNRLRFEFGREGLTGWASVNSVLTSGDSLEIYGRSAPRSNTYDFWSGRYETSVGATALRAYASYSVAETTARKGLLGTLGFEGEEKSVRVGARYPLVRSRRHTVFLQGELWGADSSSEALGLVLIKDRIRTVEFDLVSDWASAGGASSLFKLGVISGLDGLGATKADNPLASRAAGVPDFLALTARYFRDQPVGAGLRFKVDLDGQAMVEGSALAPAECSYGGEWFGRAYDAGAIGGDQCLRASAELSRPYRLSPRLALEPYAFADGGWMSQRGSLAVGEPRRTNAQSAGLGLRAAFSHGIVLDVAAARPLQPAYAEKGDQTRFYFSLGIRR